jgi:hypothetical protein
VNAPLLGTLLGVTVLAPTPPPDTPLARATRVGLQTWDAPPERVLPLLTPSGEEAWAVGWAPEIRWQPPDKGVGTLFVTHGHQQETVWILKTFDTAHGVVAYSHLTPGALIVELTLTLTPLAGGKTQANIRYVFTALSERGNATITQMTEEHFAALMHDWEAELNHFLRTGRKLDAHHP